MKIRNSVVHEKTNIKNYFKNNYGEQSAYWDDYHGKRREGEDSRSNPDVLEDNRENLFWPSRYSEIECDVLDELKDLDFSTLLTKKESQVLKYLIIENKKFIEIEHATGLSRQRVNQLYSSIQKKIKNYLKLGE